MKKKRFFGLAFCVLMITATSSWAGPVLDTGDPAEPVCNPQSYTDNGDETIQDNVTGLMWQKEIKPQRLWINPELYTETFASYSDWRIPTVAELATLVDSGRSMPAINPIFDMPEELENDEGWPYWTADACVASSSLAWYINFDYGRVHYDKSINTPLFIRPVRGPFYGSGSTFVINGDGTVSAPNTDLMWQQCKSGQTWTGALCDGSSVPEQWNQAVAYIENLNNTSYLGYDDWRLPTRNELQSLLDYSLYYPATSFPNIQTENYWSSTTLAGYSNDNAWGVGFEYGYVMAYEKIASGHIRAVRNQWQGCWFSEEGDCLANSDCENGNLCVNGRCKCQNDAQCDDDVDCNGEEICDSGACIEGTTTCAVEEYCDESMDACVECLSDAHCGDDVFCNGAEVCTDGMCGEGAGPCDAGELCDENGNQCLECFVDSDCTDDSLYCTGRPFCEESLCGFEDPCTGETPVCDEANNQCVAGFIQIDKASIKAGKNADTDSIKLSGLLDASEDDLLAAIGGNVVVSFMADYIPGSGAIEYIFPVKAEYLKSGKYTSPKVKAVSVTSFSLDTSKGTIKFSAKKVDLTGMSCPVTCRVTIGDDIYIAEVEMNEDIVNGPKKPCPLPLIMGLSDSLNATKVKAKKSTKTDSDSISVSGTFSIDGIFDTNEPLIITLGSDTFTVPGAEFSVKKDSDSCKSYDSGNGLISAKFDAIKCTFSISIKSTTLSDSGNVDFGLNLFNNQLWASSQISLPPDP
jgi:hypothetical protein